ncbi:MAG: DNA polymerase III subunit alpha [Pyrinomonadaceae bacterium]|nr:DNA polymerase III subunit alpha [Pyrinomonadaceae bacterium]
MNRKFTHLKVRTDFSLLESTIRVPALVKRLTELDMNCCAITDKGNLFAALSFYNSFKYAGLKPILGYEAYLTNGSRFERETVLKSHERPYYPLTLLATNWKGYQNLVELSSRSYTEGYHHKPRVDVELLSQYGGNIIALSGGVTGIIGHLLGIGKSELAEAKTRELTEIFGRENFYIEVQNHGVSEETEIWKKVAFFARETNVKIVATNDVCFLRKEDSRAYRVINCLGKGVTLDVDGGSSVPHFYLRSADEMWQAFGGELASALEATQEIADRCEVEIPKEDDHSSLPNYPIPVESNCKTTPEYFEKIVRQGFAERDETVWEPARKQETLRHNSEDYEQRLQKEIQIINQMGFPGYFLIVWDFINFARQNDIPVGPGRGSAAGSLVAYCLGITDVDPLHYDLLFERFLNPERVSMPDIDVDFCVRGREDVIAHVVKRYGRDCVCQIITFGTMASRAAVKDVGRVLNIPYPRVEQIAKLIPPPVRGRNVTISQALEQVPELKAMAENDPAVKDLIDLAQKLEGCARHTSVHAAGVVIAPRPLNQMIPVTLSSKNELTTQYAMSDLEKTGMLKMDFLALTTLTVASDCLKHLKSSGIEITWQTVPLDDKSTMKIFGDGNTGAVFQFESPGMQEICKRLMPHNIEDLAALNALYRPGPLDGGMVDDYIARHKGQKPVRYLVPAMKSILDNTYGIIVYQEQIMQLAQQLAGYTLGEADMMRRAMGKKKREEMALHEQKFVTGAIERNIKREKAEQIFSLMAQFADYGFNKSHSVAYAYLAFQTAYLKAHHPAYFYAAVLSHEFQNAEKVNKYLNELKGFGVKLLPPDINHSDDDFTPSQKTIRFGLNAIKNLGLSSARVIMENRAERKYESLTDFVMRLPTGTINRKALENLIYAGALDSMNHQNQKLNLWRSYLWNSIESALSSAKKTAKDAGIGQTNLFGTSTSQKAQADCVSPETPVWSDSHLWTTEKQALGFYLTNHPLDGTEEMLREIKVSSISDLSTAQPVHSNEQIEQIEHAEHIESSDENAKADSLLPHAPLIPSKPSKTIGRKLSIAGIISELQIRSSKKGTRFALFQLEDKTGSLKCLLWGESFAKCSAQLKPDIVVVATGSLETEKEGGQTFMVERVTTLESARLERASVLKIVLNSKQISEDYADKLLDLLNEHRGDCKVIFEIKLESGLKSRLATHDIINVKGSVVLNTELQKRGCEVHWLQQKSV